MKTRKNLSSSITRSVPYAVRLRNYEREKTEVVAKNFGVSPEKMTEILKDLANKWEV